MAWSVHLAGVADGDVCATSGGAFDKSGQCAPQHAALGDGEQGKSGLACLLDVSQNLGVHVASVLRHLDQVATTVSRVTDPGDDALSLEFVQQAHQHAGVDPQDLCQLR